MAEVIGLGTDVHPKEGHGGSGSPGNEGDQLTMLSDYLSEAVEGGVGQHDRKVDKIVEAKMAVALGEQCQRRNFRYGNGYIMAFDGKAYRLMTDKEVECMIVQALEKKAVGMVYTVNSVNVIRKHIERKVVREYRPRKHLVSFDNLVLNMDDGQTYKHAEDLETNIRIPYDYNPRAKCPVFLKFLHEVLPNEEVVKTLQEFAGALFVDRRKFKIENILFLIGVGQNGKGVFAEALQDTLGAGNYTTFSVDRLVKASDKAGNVAAMNGKVANICPDMSKGDISGGDFKTIVSGEGIQARFQYGRSFIANDLPLIIANVNEMPVTTDHTFGHHRRPLPIPFNVTISNEAKDVELPMKLRNEVSGIFNWVYEGRKRFVEQNGKFTESIEIELAKERIRIESNSALQFLQDKMFSREYSDGATELFMTNQEIYRQYETYCRDYGKRNLFESGSISKILMAEGYVQVRKMNGRGYTFYVGGKRYNDLSEVAVSREQVAVDLDLPF